VGIDSRWGRSSLVAAIERLKCLFRSLREKNSSGFPDGLGLTALLCEHLFSQPRQMAPCPSRLRAPRNHKQKTRKRWFYRRASAAEDLAETDDANIPIHGARYPEEHMKRVGL
jgi:hypothetical protein